MNLRGGGVNWGKIAVVALIAAAGLAGVGLWWSATYAYWSEDRDAIIRATLIDGTVAPLAVTDIAAVRSKSSPLGFRACFSSAPSLAIVSKTYRGADTPVPTVPPSWFDCFDPAAISAGLETGAALAFVAEKNIAFGVDRVVAVFDDGRGFAWHVLNNCGRKAYDGSVVGESCPERATFQGRF